MKDPLTGLGNRNFFDMRLQHALDRAVRQSEQICLLFLDLDGFKAVNDTYGHVAGDGVLREIAGRLMAAARKPDTVARLGGDEFAVVMETGATRAGAQTLCERITGAVVQPIAVDGQSVELGVSIGTAMFPDDCADAETLLRLADDHMYAVKNLARAGAATVQGLRRSGWGDGPAAARAITKRRSSSSARDNRESRSAPIG